MKKKVIGSVLALIGIGIVAWAGGWLVAAGMVIALTGNDLERSDNHKGEVR